MEQDYKKSWNTLKAESGGRWCQPHPLSNELLTIGELMRNMEKRASESAELAATVRSETAPANNRSDEIALLEEAIEIAGLKGQIKARVFMAEFTSRSKTAPQAEHTHSLTDSPAHPCGPDRAPHDEQVLVEFLLSISTNRLSQELLL